MNTKDIFHRLLTAPMGDSDTVGQYTVYRRDTQWYAEHAVPALSFTFPYVRGESADSAVKRFNHAAGERFVEYLKTWQRGKRTTEEDTDDAP